MRILPFLCALLLPLTAGCLDADKPPPTGGGTPTVDCPLVAEPQEGSVTTDVGEYNVSWGSPLVGPYGGSSGDYKDFPWDWPYGSHIEIAVRAEWDQGTLGEKSMQLRVGDDILHPWATMQGPSPLLLNLNMEVPEDNSLRVAMHPHAETAGMPMGVAVNKEEMEVKLTVVQTMLCP